MSTAARLHSGHDDGDEALFARIADDLERQGYCILPSALPETVSNSLLQYLAELEAGSFHGAAVGRGAQQTRNRFVRRDKVRWIEESEAGSRVWLQWNQRLRRYLNRRLFLGLFDFESHFSCYRPGDFYKKHYDAFTGRSNRVLSLVTYLNKGWEADQGGELLLYVGRGEEKTICVQPGFATLVIFLSQEFPHEVLPTRRERFAVAGWFRINASVNDAIDPPR